uniref:Exonuclease III n=1 Tax=Micromonospora marina TaxID=307120 RepID=A0A1C5A8J1_9ACTN|nr:endonuclease/exonuclease/phosphatase family protein [Micromonospora marina]SCF41552.1 Exonuclease III [Micromonospora marina]
MGVVTWNVQRAASARARSQMSWLASQPDADVVVLTEIPRSGAAHADALHAHGYRVLCPEPDGDYRVLVAARVGAVTPVAGLYAGGMSGRFVAARIALTGPTTLGIVGLYVPSRGSREHRNVAKRLFQTEVAAMLPRLGRAYPDASPLIVAGDLNVVEPGHLPAHRVFGQWEYDFYRAFAGAGLIDAYRHVHPRTVEHSWYGRSGAGYRFDHVFCDDPGLVLRCAYLHAPRRAKLSDHSAMTATFGLTSPVTGLPPVEAGQVGV